jgi:hypothetical protein
MTELMTSEKFASLVNDIAAIDMHTHLNARHLGARGLHDIMLYHMLISDLYCAGCPDGGRLSDELDEKEARERIERAIPYLPLVENTSTYYLMRTILSDLYGWNDRITASNWRKLDEIIRRKNQKTWPREVFEKAGVARAGTELPLRGDGSYDDILFYALEWAFFARMQWGVFDAPLFELEYAWQQNAPTRPLPVTTGKRPAVAKTIKTVQDVHSAIAHYCDIMQSQKVLSTAQHISTDIEYTMVSDEEMQQALGNRGHAGQGEMNVYASYILEKFFDLLEKSSRPIIYQFSLGAEPLPYETASRLSSRTIAQLAAMISRHPKITFQCFLSSRHSNQSLCTLCRELPNLHLAGYWWHNFFPAIIPQVIEERLDMLALNKQTGFFSDAYCVEWMYAKSKLVRKLIADVLYERMVSRRYDTDTAIEIANWLLRKAAGTLVNIA